MINQNSIETLFSSYATDKNLIVDIGDVEAGKKTIIENISRELEFYNPVFALMFNHPKFTKDEVYERLLNAKVKSNDRDIVFQLLTRTYELDFQTVLGSYKALQLKQDEKGLYMPTHVTF